MIVYQLKTRIKSGILFEKTDAPNGVAFFSQDIDVVEFRVVMSVTISA